MKISKVLIIAISIFLFIVLSIAGVVTYLILTIDSGNRNLSEEEITYVNSEISEYYQALKSMNYKDISAFFENGKVDIKIHDGLTGLKNYERDYLGYIDDENSLKQIGKSFFDVSGKLITTQFGLYEFVEQPYNYAIGNVFFVEVINKFANFETHEDFFIVKDSGKIFEHKIYVRELS